mmetsp:Transcript_34599/g.73697  ORF Transcript_34599/g.73697 Transcript_34599/m.73697 type:complete len:117 (+) Transcript_34599:165-515(+)|eukprot:CAMPEP_0206530948 /NCGR_PEP_ID=MMETSP0325_2-20121206/3481_1 /ASSEMBLY_ACC=CAM_ASM_000347 /TAXON_ID=2866 /ORGANISM="Crypthecodinium cohnii, Strain Seligo" /LENGTH=116 /DNA_ID=CAMNT_0054027113 /DNA_START=185 /DNA_END=535 /DNA_ORIENTATION=-
MARRGEATGYRILDKRSCLEAGGHGSDGSGLAEEIIEAINLGSPTRNTGGASKGDINHTEKIMTLPARLACDSAAEVEVEVEVENEVEVKVEPGVLQGEHGDIADSAATGRPLPKL